MKILINYLISKFEIDFEAATNVAKLFHSEMRTMGLHQFIEWVGEILCSKHKEECMEFKLEYNDWHGEDASFIMDYQMEPCDDL